MPNINITSICNRSCPYCFAMDSKKAGEYDNHIFMTIDNIQKAMSFLKKSEYHTFSIIGGEPTLHPQFKDIINLAMDEGFKVFIFTNGICRKSIATFLGAFPDDKIGILVNVNHPDSYSEGEYAKLNYSLSQFGVKASLGFNIYLLNYDFTFFIDLIEKHNSQKIIRIGLTHPILNRDNSYIHTENYPKIAEILVEQAEICDQHDIRIGMDCGFVLCMFSTEQLGKLTKFGAEISFECKPVIDIGAKLDCWSCFPLFSWKRVNIEDFENITDIIEYFNQQQLLYHRSGIYKQCFNCRYLMRGQCKGGCVSHVISGYKH